MASENELYCLRPNPRATIRLFCFTGAGGSASLFFRWPEYLPPSIEVYALQPPGLAAHLEGTVMSTYLAQIAYQADMLAPYQDRPFAFFGLSLGALVAFEVARTLRRYSGVEPIHLFLSSFPAPQLLDDKETIQAFFENIRSNSFLIEKEAGVLSINTTHLLASISGYGEMLLRDADIRSLFDACLQRDVALWENYIYREDDPFHTPITIFGGWHDQLVSYKCLPAWKTHTVGKFSLRMVPGDHFFHVSQKHHILKAITEQLLASE